jgi:phenylacetate-CoA ligase
MDVVVTEGPRLAPGASIHRQDTMSFFKLRTLPGYTWPPLADNAIAQVWVAYLELERTQWLDPAEIERRQLLQLRSLLAHAITQVPYYREVLPQAGIVPGAIQTIDAFRRIPLLSRRTYQEKAAAFESRSVPPGTVATGSRQTSGSSGTPITVLQTNLVHLWWCAFFLRDLAWAGVDPTGELAIIRSTGFKGDRLQRFLQGESHPNWLAELAPLLVTGPAHSMDIQQDQRRQLQWLRRIAPNYLLSYPGNLEALAHLVAREGRLESLKVIQAISETLTEEAQAAIEAAFGVPVKNTYSCAETGYLASPCPAGHGLHVHAENVLLEVLDEAGQPCRPGETGKVYVTHLNNYRAPLLRYDLGDEATLGKASCPCGRGLPLLARVQGKRYPLFVLPDGRRKSSVTVAHLLRKLGGHWQHQVIQTAADRVVVRLAVAGDWTSAKGDELKRKLQAFFEAPIRVDVELHERLPMPASGKFQSMIREID